MFSLVNAKVQSPQNVVKSRSKGPLSINSPHQMAPPRANMSDILQFGISSPQVTADTSTQPSSSSPHAYGYGLKELLLGALSDEILKNGPNGSNFPWFLETNFLTGTLPTTSTTTQVADPVIDDTGSKPLLDSRENPEVFALGHPKPGPTGGLHPRTSSAALDEMRGKLLHSLHATTSRLLEQETTSNDSNNNSTGIKATEAMSDCLFAPTDSNGEDELTEAADMAPLTIISAPYVGNSMTFPNRNIPTTAKSCITEISSILDSTSTAYEKVLSLTPIQPNPQEALAKSVADLESGSTESFSVFIEKMKLNEERLTRLVVHQLATNALLKLVGQEAKNLKILDVKGSQAVTNEGIQSLFLSPRPEHASLAMSWIYKHGNCINPVTKTLEYLDVTYTSVNYTSRRFINFLPGCYPFPRNFYTGESNCSGHNIFYRKMPDLGFVIKTPGGNRELEAQLGVIAGNRGASNFKKLIERHSGWKNYLVSVRNPDKNRRIPKEFKEPVTVIVTPTKDDKRIYGEVLFESGDVSGLYSYLPLDVNTVVETCPKIKNLNCELHGIWENPNMMLQMLTTLNAVADVVVFHSLLPQCPNLRCIKFRISEGLLQDEEFIKTIESSASSAVLQELWIVPAFLHLNDAQPRGKSLQRKPSIAATKQISYCTPPSLPQRDSLRGRPLIKIHPEHLKNSACASHCMLSIDSLHQLIYSCPKLTFIGNLLFWEKLSLEEYEKLRIELASISSAQILERNCIYVWDLDLSTHWNL